MASIASSNPNLRLVGRDPGDQWAQADQARLAVGKENRLAAHASGLDPSDPRWILAMQTQARLQGATLTPERRDHLMRSAHKLGLRPFEANLVIAIVQDRARTGSNVEQARPTLRLMSATAIENDSKENPSQWPLWLAAIGAGAMAAAVLIAWLTSA